MEDWEAGYMRELAKMATSNGGVVLEVGFGLGLSATYIQAQPFDKHLIIVANQEVFSQLQEFANRAKQPVEALFGFWQEVLPTIAAESLDRILFDTYPISKDDFNYTPAVHFFQTAYRVLKPGGVFTYFSYEVDDFSKPHLEKLSNAGFRQIEKRVVPVRPPKECEYWGYQTILAPIIRR
jgi:guanidinoacetate N-methyltransferase